MESKSINQILDAVKAAVANYPMLKDWGHGHTSDIGTRRDEGRQLLRPFLWTDYVSTQYIVSSNARGIAYKIYTFSFTVLDKYTPNLKNSQEVMSDTEGMLSDFIQWFTNNRTLRDYRIQMQSYTAFPVRDEDKDGDEGWTCNVAFKVPYEFCFANLPFNGNT